MRTINKYYGFILLLVLGAFASSCKEEYFQDGGLADPVYPGTIYDYLQEHTDYLDTVAYVVERAGMDSLLSTAEVTFFSPTDDAIEQAMDALNLYRYRMAQDSVHLEDISPDIWERFLSMYVLEGKHMARDFARVDDQNIDSYPGINYFMLNDYIMNIGLIYADYQNVEAVGPRTIRLTDISVNPDDFNSNASVTVATSDILPSNGVLHVLSNQHIFGFRANEFVRIAEQDLQLRE